MGLVRRIANFFAVMAAMIFFASGAFAQAASDVSSGAISIAAIAGAPAQDDGYKLGSGDKLHITVFGEMDLTRDYEVDGTGLVSFPFIGQIRAAGLSSREFEKALKTKLDDGYFRDVNLNIEVINYRPFYILGEVKSPGEYPFVNGMSAINAIARAGGYSDRAYKNRIFIRRGGSASEQEISANEGTKIFPGDIIRVPERFF